MEEKKELLELYRKEIEEFKNAKPNLCEFYQLIDRCITNREEWIKNLEKHMEEDLASKDAELKVEAELMNVDRVL